MWIHELQHLLGLEDLTIEDVQNYCAVVVLFLWANAFVFPSRVRPKNDDHEYVTLKSLKEFLHHRHSVSSLVFMGWLPFLAVALSYYTDYVPGNDLIENKLREITPILYVGICCVGFTRARNFTAGYLIAICGSLLSATVFLTSGLDLLDPDIGLVNRTRAAALLVGSLSNTFAFIGLRRYPDLTFDDETLDRQSFASVIEFLSFSWGADSYIDHADPKAKNRDLPAPRLHDRTSHIVDRTAPYDPATGLWFWLFKVHKGAFLAQWALVIFQASFTMVPPYFILQFLQALEEREPDAPASPELILIVIGIAFSTFAEKFIALLEHAVTYRWLRQPISALLTSMVYRKVMRLENANDPDLAKESTNTSRASKAIMTHIRTDAGKVAGATNDIIKIPVAFFELVFASFFLVKLLNIKVVVIGALISLLSIPVGSFFSNLYSNLQFGLAKHRDDRMSLLTQVLQNIRQIRLSAAEDFWLKNILEVRQREQKDEWVSGIAMCVYVFMANASLVCLGALPLAIYASENGGITAAVAFTCMGLFSTINGSLSMVPLTWSYVIEARAAAQRLETFFRRPERTTVTVPSEKIIFDDASVTWPTSTAGEKQGAFQLSNLNFAFPLKRFSIVTGATASGKSLLLNAILGEVKLLSGAIKSPESLKSGSSGAPRIAFVSPDPWIEDATIQENILFGAEADDLRYRKVLEACSLRSDLRLFKHGDQTELGPKAASLSGGQRWRLSLARALYSKAKTIVLGDIMSAVDVQVREWLLKHALTGELAKGRTIILATHHVDLCRPRASFEVHLADGKVSHAKRRTPIEYRTPHYTDFSEKFGTDKEASTETSPKQDPPTPGAWDSFRIWADAGKSSAVWPLLLFVIALQRYYADSAQWRMKEITDHVNQDTPASREALQTLLKTYLAVNIFSSALLALYNLISYAISQKASKALFENMLQGILRANLNWVDNVPRGQVSGRYIGDMKSVDLYLQPSLSHLVSCIFNVLGIIITCVNVSEFVCCCALVLLVAFWVMSTMTLPVSRELQKTSDAAHAPIIDRMASLLAPGGLVTMRAYRREEDFIELMHERIDDQLTAGWANTLYDHSNGIQARLIGLALRATIVIAAVQYHTPASTVGFVLAIEGGFTRAASAVLSRITSIQGLLQSVERLNEYGTMERERATGFPVPEDWPTQGKVVINNFSAGYEYEKPILKKLNLTFEAGERVGIVGRTGAGKSSFMFALLRLIGTLSGSIIIDDVELTTIKLYDIRSRLFVIPQDPFLYNGTLRANVDPMSKHSDADILAALGKAQISLALDFAIAENGGNLSQGQRQLICLSRALLARPKVLVLDEATSSVDMETDALVQRVLRREFEGSTMIVIAHRLSTVADFDQIVVLAEGAVAESGAPGDLVATKGAFWNMVKDSADSEELLTTIQRAKEAADTTS